MLTRALMIAAASFAIGGCSTLSEYGAFRTQDVTDAQGHVIGQKQLLRNQQTGEVIAQVNLFTPLLNEQGELIGYEEATRGGTIVRDLDGRPIGGRFTDLRSRGTNARNKGLLLVVRGPDKPQIAQVAAAKPQIFELMASLSVSELNRIR